MNRTPRTIVVLKNSLSNTTYFGLELDCGHEVNWIEGNSDNPPEKLPKKYHCPKCAEGGTQ